MFSLLIKMLGGGNIAIYLVAFVAATGVYYLWVHNIRESALREYNIEQLKSVAEANRKFIEVQELIRDSQNLIIERLNVDKETIKLRVNAATITLNSSATSKQDSPAADIIKNTIDQLRTIK